MATARREREATTRERAASDAETDDARTTDGDGRARDDDDDRARGTKYWLRRRCSTGSHASEGTEVEMLTGGESSNESHQATGRRTRREGGGVGVDADGGRAREGERRDRRAGTLRVRDADEREGVRGGDDDAENADAGER